MSSFSARFAAISARTIAGDLRFSIVLSFVRISGCSSSGCPVSLLWSLYILVSAGLRTTLLAGLKISAFIRVVNHWNWSPCSRFKGTFPLDFDRLICIYFNCCFRTASVAVWVETWGYLAVGSWEWALWEAFCRLSICFWRYLGCRLTLLASSISNFITDDLSNAYFRLWAFSYYVMKIKGTPFSGIDEIVETEHNHLYFKHKTFKFQLKNLINRPISSKTPTSQPRNLSQTRSRPSFQPSRWWVCVCWGEWGGGVVS